MADPRFFKKTRHFKLSEIAKVSESYLLNEADADIQIDDVASLADAGKNQLSFLDNVRYKKNLPESKAAACIMAEDYKDLAPPGMAVLISKTPYKSYALAAQAFYPLNTVKPTETHKSASIAKSADIGAGCYIGANAVIDEGAKIGMGCVIEAGAYIGENVEMGEYCRIGVNASVTHCLMGDHVRLYPGVRVGQDGFGFAIDAGGHVPVPQLGRVIIGNGVQIGANSCIDRGAGPDTVIGEGCWIDNLVQIGHNVKMGRGCVIVSQVGISGSTTLGDFVVLGGQVGVAGHLNIGTGVRVGAQSGVMRDAEAGKELLGSPAVPSKEFMRQVAALKGLIKKKK